MSVCSCSDELECLAPTHSRHSVCLHTLYLPSDQTRWPEWEASHGRDIQLNTQFLLGVWHQAQDKGAQPSLSSGSQFGRKFRLQPGTAGNFKIWKSTIPTSAFKHVLQIGWGFKRPSSGRKERKAAYGVRVKKLREKGWGMVPMLTLHCTPLPPAIALEKRHCPDHCWQTSETTGRS